MYYSGSGSHDNEDPKFPAESTSGTRALHRSIITMRPVRVLRKANDKKPYCPSAGLRYDGLYRVVKVNLPTNAKGGLYEQFVLERQGGQSRIEKGTRPNALEVTQELEINAVNFSAWPSLQ